MALVSLLLKKTQARTTFRENKSDADILVIDCTIKRNTTLSSEATSIPVEEGPDVSDHIKPKPIIIQIDGVISETPLSLEAQKAALVTTGGSFVAKNLAGFKGGVAETVTGAGAGAIGSKLYQSSQDSVAEAARIQLEKLVLNRIRFTVSVGKKMLDDMVMTNLSFAEDQDSSAALRFSCTIQQIRVVKGQSVFIEKVSRTAAHTAAKKQNLGAQATTEATKEQRKSLLKSLTGTLFGGK